MVPEGYTDECKNDKYAPSYITRLSQEAMIELHIALKSVVREWVGDSVNNIKLAGMYGVRRYTRGSGNCLTTQTFGRQFECLKLD